MPAGRPRPVVPVAYGLTMSHHPWRELRALAQVILHWRDDLPAGTRGLTDGHRVWMASGMSQVQRRCTIAHEVEHIRRGEAECQPEAVERSVRRSVARRLIPDVHELATTLVWAASLDEAADHLWVTTEVLQDRLGGLHPAERAIILARVQRDVWA